MKEHDLRCPEPGCGGRLRLRRNGKWGPWYACERWAETGCPGAHGCHRGGTPLGIPADYATRQARRRAHAAFDLLWRGRRPRMSRPGAYAWLARMMGMTAGEAHIGRFTAEQCARTEALLRQTYGIGDAAPRPSAASETRDR